MVDIRERIEELIAKNGSTDVKEIMRQAIDFIEDNIYAIRKIQDEADMYEDVKTYAKEKGYEFEQFQIDYIVGRTMSKWDCEYGTWENIDTSIQHMLTLGGLVRESFACKEVE